MSPDTNFFQDLAARIPPWLRPSAFLFVRQANLVLGPLILALPVLIVLALLGRFAWRDLLFLLPFLLSFITSTSIAGGLAYALVRQPLSSLGTAGVYAAAFVGAGAYALATLEVMNVTAVLIRDTASRLQGPVAWLAWSLLTLIGGLVGGAVLTERSDQKTSGKHAA